VLLVTLVSLFSLTEAFAQEESCDIVESVGRAAIMTDPATARDRALIDAKVRAAEKYGVLVDARSIVNMGMALDQFAQIKAFAFVKAYDVLKEWKQGRIYHVKIKAWVKKGEAKEKAQKELLSSRLILILTDGKGSDIIEDILTDRLSSSGFSLLDGDFIKAKVNPATWQCLRTGNLSCIDKEFYPYLANYLIRIRSRLKLSQNNSGILSFRANAKILCTQISTAILCPTSQIRGIVFGLNEGQAIEGQRDDQFEKSIAEPICSDFMEKLSREFSQSKRNIRITITGLPDKQAFDNFKLLVKELRWVDPISDDDYNQGTGWISVPYAEKSVYLASMIAFRSIYKVTRYAWDRVEVGYNASAAQN